MSALFERAQKTVVMITSVPVTAAELDTAPMPMAPLSPLLISPSPSVNGAPGNRR